MTKKFLFVLFLIVSAANLFLTTPCKAENFSKNPFNPHQYPAPAKEKVYVFVPVYYTPPSQQQPNIIIDNTTGAPETVNSRPVYEKGMPQMEDEYFKDPVKFPEASENYNGQYYF